MKTWSRTRFAAIAMVASLGLAYSAHADEKLVKSATLTLKGWKVAFIGSAGQSKGVLSYQGKSRKFSRLPAYVRASRLRI